MLLLSLLLLCAFISIIVPYAEASDSQELWALIICGSANGSFSNNTQYMYHVLSEHYDFDGIYYLDVRTDLPGVNASATRANFQWAIRNWLHDRSDIDDLIFIFSVGHGGGYNANMDWMEGGRIDDSQDDIVDEGPEHIIGGNWEGVDECIFFDTGGQYWDDELTVDFNTLTYSKLHVHRRRIQPIQTINNSTRFSFCLRYKVC